MPRQPKERTESGWKAYRLRSSRRWTQQQVAERSRTVGPEQLGTRAIRTFETAPEKSQPTTIETMARVYDFPTAQELRRAVGLDTPSVSVEIHKSTQNGTSRAGVPSITREIPRTSDYADPSKADVLEGPDMKDLELYVRSLGLTPENFAQWKLAAAGLAEKYRGGIQPGTGKPQTG